MRLFLIISLLIALVADIGVAAYVEKYEIDTYANYHQKEQYQRAALEGPFIIGTKEVIFWFLDFAERNDKAITALSTFVIAVFTVVLAGATGILVKMANRQEDTTKTIERAYIRISHDAPGVRWVGTEDKKTFEVRVEIKNLGHTPATVSDVVICTKILEHGVPLPSIPPYTITQREEIPSAYLMPGDAFFYTRHFGMLGDKGRSVLANTHALYILAFADYTDQFRRKFRVGYARIYNRIVDDGKQNNLFLVLQKGYNYDRPREKREGNDWDEHPPS